MANKISRRDFLKGSAAAAVGAAFFGLGGGLKAAAEEKAVYVPGTYSASAPGYSSDVTVTLTVDESSIVDCVIDAAGETPDIGQAAAREMEKLIVETQGVDAVTSATAENTLPAIRKAFDDCIAQALAEKPAAEPAPAGLTFETNEFGNPLWLTPEIGMFKWREKPAEPTEFERVESADVVVVGAGLSGICAARRSLELGNSTIILENDAKYDIHGFQCATVNADIFKRSVEAAGLNWEDWKIDETDFVRNYMNMHNNRTNIDIVRLWTANSGKAFDWYEELMPPQGEDGSYDYRSMIYFPRPEGYDMSQKDHKYKTYIGTVDFTYQSWAQAGRNQVDWINENGGEFRFSERAYMLTDDGAGRVTGVISKVTAEDGTVTYNKYEAKKGVIVCTGYHGRAKDIMMEIGVEATACSSGRARTSSPSVRRTAASCPCLTRRRASRSTTTAGASTTRTTSAGPSAWS